MSLLGNVWGRPTPVWVQRVALCAIVLEHGWAQDRGSVGRGLCGWMGEIRPGPHVCKDAVVVNTSTPWTPACAGTVGEREGAGATYARRLTGVKYYVTKRAN